MGDLLRRAHAPITAEAWAVIDDTAAQILKAHLSARTLADFRGPFGWDYAGVNLGRLDVPKGKGKPEIPWGLRRVQPLIEIRLHFKLNQWELDNISRGAADPDLTGLEETARKVALFEEQAVYQGFADGQIQGIGPASSHELVSLGKNPMAFPERVAQAREKMMQAGIAGPYTLVLGAKPFHALAQCNEGGMPPAKVIKSLIGGPTLWSPALDGGLLISTRGGDFEFSCGQDLAIGYADHDRENVELFLTESFTFRVLEPAAAVVLKAGG